MMNSKTTVATVALAVLAVAGCGTAVSTSTAPPSTSTSTSAPASRAGPANPVPILRETGAIPDSGTVYGNNTADGGRVADGTMPNGGEGVRVVTVPPGTLASYMAQSPDAQPDDSHAVITGRDFYIELTNEPIGPGGTLPYGYKVPVAVVAALVHGTVVSPS